MFPGKVLSTWRKRGSCSSVEKRRRSRGAAFFHSWAENRGKRKYGTLGCDEALWGSLSSRRNHNLLQGESVTSYRNNPGVVSVYGGGGSGGKTIVEAGKKGGVSD